SPAERRRGGKRTLRRGYCRLRVHPTAGRDRRVIFNEAPLPGAFTIGLEKREDARGHFARAFCAKEFAAHGLETAYVQANLSLNEKAGLVRGMHFQCGADAEVKLVRCVRGAIYDVIVDNRPDSPTYLQW